MTKTPDRPRPILDLTGDFSDWVEIFNETAGIRRLAMTLQDEADNDTTSSQ